MISKKVFRRQIYLWQICRNEIQTFSTSSGTHAESVNPLCLLHKKLKTCPSTYSIGAAFGIAPHFEERTSSGKICSELFAKRARFAGSNSYEIQILADRFFVNAGDSLGLPRLGHEIDGAAILHEYAAGRKHV